MYLVVLVLQLNPRVPTVSMAAARWTGAVLGLYVPYLGVAIVFLLLFRDLMAARPLRPAWFSVRMLAWLGTAGAGAAAAITWANLNAFQGMLTPDGAARMRDGAWATSLCAGALLVIALARYSFGRRGSRATASLMLATMILSVLAPVWLRGPGETPVVLPRRWSPPARIRFPPRVRVLVFDGASLGFIRQRVAAGQLANLARLLDRGASIDLATLRPTEADPVWAAAATGKLAQQNGVRSNESYRVSQQDSDPVDVLPDYCFSSALVSQGFVRQTDNTSASLRARPVWDILADYGLTSGIVNWPLTYPSRAPTGYVVSDRFDEAAASPLRLADASAGDPTTAVDVARETFDAWQAKPWYEVLTTFTRDEVEPVDVNRARWDRAYADTAAELEEQFAPRFTAVRYEGLETFGLTYLRQAQPELFGRSPVDASRPAGARSLLRLSRRGGRQGDPRAGAGRPAAGRLGVRDGTEPAEQAPAGPPAGRTGVDGDARFGAGRLPAGLRHERGDRPVSTRVGGRFRADRPVLHGGAGRAGHGRIRPHRPVPANLRPGASGEVRREPRKVSYHSGAL